MSDEATAKQILTIQLMCDLADAETVEEREAIVTRFGDACYESGSTAKGDWAAALIRNRRIRVIAAVTHELQIPPVEIARWNEQLEELARLIERAGSIVPKPMT